jgi:Spy/CpxP family protein refolding chaperone
MSSSSVTLPRPAERAAIFSFLLVFLCGVVAGALVMSLAKNAGMHGAAPVSSGFSMSVTEMKNGLNLTDEQTRQLTSILDDFSHYYDYLLADGNSRILQILDPDQKKLFQQLLQQHRK